MQHFVKNDPQRPDIVLDSVNIVLESLRAHVQGRSYIHSFFGVGSDSLGETEVSNFGDFVFHEDVGRLEIAVEEA